MTPKEWTARAQALIWCGEYSMMDAVERVVREAILTERERCARLADSYAKGMFRKQSYVEDVAWDIGQKIRDSETE